MGIGFVEIAILALGAAVALGIAVAIFLSSGGKKED